MNLKVSIIIPVYNRSELIRETLDSVLEQTYSNWQCIAVDDGSTDNSMDILAEYANINNRFTFFQRPESRSKGANVCRNIGLQNAVGDYVMFLDSDDLLSPICLEERVAFASSFSEADMCVFKMNFFKERPGDTDLLVNKTELREVETYLKKYLKYDIPWPITAMFIKRASLKIEFDEELTRFQDVDFGIRYLLDSTRKVKISDNNKADCFYRMPVPSEKRHLDYNFINNINSSQLRLMKTIISEVEEKISDRKSQKEHLKLLDYFFRRNFRIYILPYIDHIDTSYRKLRKLLWKKGIISFKTFITYGIIERMHLWKWHEKKGTGAYTLTKKWIK